MTNYLQGVADGLAATFCAAGAYILLDNWWLAAFTYLIVWLLALSNELLTYDSEVTV